MVVYKPVDKKIFLQKVHNNPTYLLHIQLHTHQPVFIPFILNYLIHPSLKEKTFNIPYHKSSLKLQKNRPVLNQTKNTISEKYKSKSINFSYKSSKTLLNSKTSKISKLSKSNLQLKSTPSLQTFEHLLSNLNCIFFTQSSFNF